MKKKEKDLLEKFPRVSESVTINRLSLPIYSDRELETSSIDFQSLQQSILSEGLKERLIVDNNYIVISGRHRFKAIEGLISMKKLDPSYQIIIEKLIEVDLNSMSEIDCIIFTSQFNLRAKSSKNEYSDRVKNINKLLEKGLNVKQIMTALHIGKTYVYEAMKINTKDPVMKDLLDSGASQEVTKVMNSAIKLKDLPKEIVDLAKEGKVEDLKKEIEGEKKKREMERLERSINREIVIPPELSTERFNLVMKEISELYQLDPNNEMYSYLYRKLKFIVQLDDESLQERKNKILLDIEKDKEKLKKLN